MKSVENELDPKNKTLDNLLEDVFTFLFIHPTSPYPFNHGMSVFVIQIATFSLTLFDLLQYSKDVRNPLNIYLVVQW